MPVRTKTLRKSSTPKTPKTTQSIQDGKNEPARLMEGAARQPVRQIVATKDSARDAFMAECRGFPVFASTSAGPDRRRQRPERRWIQGGSFWYPAAYSWR